MGMEKAQTAGCHPAPDPATVLKSGIQAGVTGC